MGKMNLRLKRRFGRRGSPPRHRGIPALRVSPSRGRGRRRVPRGHVRGRLPGQPLCGELDHRPGRAPDGTVVPSTSCSFGHRDRWNLFRLFREMQQAAGAPRRTGFSDRARPGGRDPLARDLSDRSGGGRRLPPRDPHPLPRRRPRPSGVLVPNGAAHPGEPRNRIRPRPDRLLDVRDLPRRRTG